MVDRVLDEWAPVVAAIAAIAFVADWLLTIAGARAYVAVRDRWSVEGSYEMNPAWVAAVERGRWLNGRVLGTAFGVGLVMIFAWLLDDVSRREILQPLFSGPTLFPAFAGAFLLVQAPTLMQHVGNLTQFRSMADPSAAVGQIRIARWFSLQQVASQYLRFAVLWLLLAGVTFQVFFAGGAIGCAVVGLRFRHFAMASRSGLLASEPRA